MSAAAPEPEALPAALAAALARPETRVHLVGIAGVGMSALAEFRRLEGGAVSGSDRFFDEGRLEEERARLRRLGVEIFPQDGSGVARADLVVASTAVEAHIPDLETARRLGRPRLHRSELLAWLVAAHESIAVTGTSGKSTVSALLHAALEGAGEDPGIVTGGELLSLRSADRRGNAAAGRGPLVVEADESDGSLVRYRPSLGVLLNLQRDHLPAEELRALFERFRARCRDGFVVAEDPALAAFRAGSLVFGFGPEARFRGRVTGRGPRHTELEVEGLRLRLPLPGHHNAFNALAALAVVALRGGDLRAAAGALEGFRGVHRRFEVLGEPGGVVVVDDFAHNPAKIAATLEALSGDRGRLFAIFQPHGFGPTRFFRDELVEAFAGGLRPGDRLSLQPIYYAGGTATRDIASDDLVADLRPRGVDAEVAPERESLARAIALEARPGDVVLNMGARDPSLHDFARRLLEAVAETAEP